MKAQFQRIIIYVGHPTQCALFYCDHFSFQPLGKWTEDWAEIESEGCKIAFHQAYDESGPIQKPTGSPDHPHKIAFLVDDVEGTRNKLIAKGVQMSEMKIFETWKLCTGYDCEGHAFQITNQ